MTEEEKKQLWAAYRSRVSINCDPEFSDQKTMMLRDQIILHFIPLTKQFVNKMKRDLPDHVDRDDLESLAKIGLLTAVKRYDNTMGVPFEAYARQWMRSVILDDIRRADPASRGLRKKQREIREIEQVFQKDGQEAPVQQVAEALGISKEEVFSTKYKASIATPAYIENSIEAQNKTFTLDSDENDIVNLAKSVVSKNLKLLSVKQATVLALHYYENKKLSEIAVLLNISDVRVGTLHSEGVLKLWQKVEEALKEEN